MVARYDTMAAEVGVGGFNWHIEHVHAARAAFAESFTWLDRFEAESDRQVSYGQVQRVWHYHTCFVVVCIHFINRAEYDAESA